MTKYQEFLQSAEWKKRRAEVIKRDRNTCIICRQTKQQMEVHHCTYNFGWLCDQKYLATLCSDCHYKVHFGTFEDHQHLFKLLDTNNVIAQQ